MLKYLVPLLLISSVALADPAVPPPVNCTEAHAGCPGRGTALPQAEALNSAHMVSRPAAAPMTTMARGPIRSPMTEMAAPTLVQMRDQDAQMLTGLLSKMLAAREEQIVGIAGASEATKEYWAKWIGQSAPVASTPAVQPR